MKQDLNASACLFSKHLMMAFSHENYMTLKKDGMLAVLFSKSGFFFLYFSIICDCSIF